MVLDLHDGPDADALGRVQGLVRGGGRLLLRLPEVGAWPPGPASLAVWPHRPEEVGAAFVSRLEAALTGPWIVEDAPLVPAPRASAGTPEQDAVVRRLEAILTDPHGPVAVLTADRGRGKSAALGRALATVGGVVTAARRENAAEVLRFAGDRARFVEATALLQGEERPEVIVVDEAAALSVPLLEALVRRHPQARWAFASTVHGYEGTGRGFALRFVAGLEARRPVVRLTLTQPIRWSAGDPLEAALTRVLALDAEPPTPREGPVSLEVVDRDRLAADEDLLRGVFGLLVQAHYRTTPADLHRLLDAPNLVLHAALVDGAPVGVCLLAREGGLMPETVAAMLDGRERIRGQALADTLVCHAGHPEAGGLTLVRSVRTVVHPALRGRGIARALVEHVHRVHRPDLFGTLFGATAGLVRFRQRLGYAVVRVGSARGARSGEPTAVMLRPVSQAGRTLVESLRRELTRDLPLTLRLLAVDGDLALDAALVAALGHDLPEPAAWDEDSREAAVSRYLAGAAPYEAVAGAVEAIVRAREARLDGLSEDARAVARSRVLEGLSWKEAARAVDGSVPAAMRRLRRAVLSLRGRPEP